jgi:hypothetical protein
LDQNILENPDSSGIGGQPSGLLKWVMVILVVVLIGGGGYWYYINYIVGSRGRVSPSPSVEVTEAIWKTKSEKTVSDFLNFCLNSSASADGQIQANKAKDLLTIVAQAKLETIKDANGQPPADLSTALNLFLGSADKAQSFSIVSTQKIDESKVAVKVNLLYANPQLKIFTVTNEDGIWLIDQVQDYQELLISPSPSPSPLPSSS